MRNEQDIRKLTGLFQKTPLISIFFIIGSLSLMGIPHLSGYYSKDAIIGLSRLYEANLVIYFLTIVGVISTTFYSIRLFFYLFAKQDFKRKGSLKFYYGYKTNYFNVV